MTLNELLCIKELKERNYQLRRAFAPDSDGLEVDGLELEALTVLLNLSLKKYEVEDLCEQSIAKQALMDDKHIHYCCAETRWLHSHNLKFPDARVSKQRLLIGPPEVNEGALSSANLPARLGWSHDSAKIRKAYLFCSEFVWNQQWVNLRELLLSKQPIWLDALKQLGLSTKRCNELIAELEAYDKEEHVPSVISPFSKQVLMPFRDSYCAVTPVASHAVQSELMRLDYNSKQGRFIRLQHEHSANIGNLCATHGGRVSCLFYPPNTTRNGTPSLNSSWISKVEGGGIVFDQGAINNKHFYWALKKLVTSGLELTLKQRRRARLSALRRVRSQIAQWLSPLAEWRDSLEETPETLTKLDDGTIEYRFLVTPTEGLHTLANELTLRLNEELEKDRFGRAFAYHPSLIKPLKSQVDWLLKYMTQNGPDAEGRDEICYIHLSNLRVFDANALASQFLCGIPSLSAAWGMCHRFERDLNKLLPFKVHVDSFAWYIHQYSLVSGKSLPEPSLYKKGELKRPGFVANKRCDLTMDLVLKMSHSGGSLTTSDLPLIQAALPARFAGGSVHPPSLHEQKEWCHLHTDEADLFQRVTRTPATGCWIMPSTKSVSSYEELIETVEEDLSSKPAMLGYLLLEEPQSREGSIEKLHAFTEPVAGLVKCVSAIDVRLMKLHKFCRNGFWQMEVKDRSMLMAREQ